MGKGKNHHQPIPKKPAPAANPAHVPSLLGVMEDGREYASIVDKAPAGGDVLVDVVQAIKEIEAIRERPCICYIGSLAKPGASIDVSDDLPFQEMVNQIPADIKKVDVFLSTPGGSAGQVARFVDFLRNRFDQVDFLIPSFCMSAGTLFAVSGDRIWMTPGACLGPTDPQIPTATGRYVPAQALLLLVDQLKAEGTAAIARGENVPWTSIRIVDTMDKRELAEAITASAYSSTMAAEFLRKYKFRHWITRHSAGVPVTDEYRKLRAEAIASALASHDKWKNHGHAISREVLLDQIKLQIDHPSAQLERAMERLWALFTWSFDKSGLLKIFISKDYRFFRIIPQ